MNRRHPDPEIPVFMREQRFVEDADLFEAGFFMHDAKHREKLQTEDRCN